MIQDLQFNVFLKKLHFFLFFINSSNLLLLFSFFLVFFKNSLKKLYRNPQKRGKRKKKAAKWGRIAFEMHLIFIHINVILSGFFGVLYINIFI
jgi:hypothetical protein